MRDGRARMEIKMESEGRMVEVEEWRMKGGGRKAEGGGQMGDDGRERAASATMVEVAKS